MSSGRRGRGGREEGERRTRGGIEGASHFADLGCVHASSVTAAGQEVGVSGVDHDGSDVVGVSLERVHLLKSVIVEDSH